MRIKKGHRKVDPAAGIDFDRPARFADNNPYRTIPLDTIGFSINHDIRFQSRFNETWQEVPISGNDSVGFAEFPNIGGGD
jgi:hypothetical protein